jgi:hypothetical protein
LNAESLRVCALWGASFGLVCALSRSAHAQDVAAAEVLFRNGRDLLEQGDYAGACPKLAESYRLDPSSGTALNLALCHYKQGKTATAWAEYLVAARVSRQQNQNERVVEAQRIAAELEPELSRLTVIVNRPVAGEIVMRDEVELAASSFATSLPVDPGKHTIRASAPGYEPISLEVTIGAARDAQRIVVPALTLRADASVHRSGERRSSALPWVFGGAGLAALAVGSAFGVLALDKYGDAKRACPTRTDCGQGALDARASAGKYALVADIGVGLGVLGIGAAGVLLLTPSVDEQHAGVRLAGSF